MERAYSQLWATGLAAYHNWSIKLVSVIMKVRLHGFIAVDITVVSRTFYMAMYNDLCGRARYADVVRAVQRNVAGAVRSAVQTASSVRARLQPSTVLAWVDSST